MVNNGVVFGEGIRYAVSHMKWCTHYNSRLFNVVCDALLHACQVGPCKAAAAGTYGCIHSGCECNGEHFICANDNTSTNSTSIYSKHVLPCRFCSSFNIPPNRKYNQGVPLFFVCIEIRTTSFGRIDIVWHSINEKYRPVSIPPSNKMMFSTNNNVYSIFDIRVSSRY